MEERCWNKWLKSGMTKQCKVESWQGSELIPYLSMKVSDWLYNWLITLRILDPLINMNSPRVCEDEARIHRRVGVVPKGSVRVVSVASVEEFRNMGLDFHSLRKGVLKGQNIYVDSKPLLWSYTLYIYPPNLTVIIIARLHPPVLSKLQSNKNNNSWSPFFPGLAY